MKNSIPKSTIAVWTATDTYLFAWTFIGHLKDKKTICQRRIAQIRRLSHSHWGSSPWVAKRLMDACILPVCPYGSPIYNPLSRGRSSRLQILRSSYRTGCIYITGAHRTTPTCSVLPLAGLHPPEADILDRLTSSKHLWHAPTYKAYREQTALHLTNGTPRNDLETHCC